MLLEVEQRWTCLHSMSNVSEKERERERERKRERERERGHGMIIFSNSAADSFISC